MKRVAAGIIAVLVGAMVLQVPAARAQSAPNGEPEAGGHELQVWTGGGPWVPGGAHSSGIWNLGLRYGWVLTDAHGPAFLRGRFEYAVDVVPIFLIFQPSGTAYGISLNPVTLKWLFDPSIRAKPYIEINGGTLFANDKVPAVGSHVNFDTSEAFGFNVPVGRFHWSAEIRLMHISNAGMTNPNPGINTLQVRIGFGLFTRRK